MTVPRHAPRFSGGWPMNSGSCASSVFFSASVKRSGIRLPSGVSSSSSPPISLSAFRSRDVTDRFCIPET